MIDPHNLLRFLGSPEFCTGLFLGFLLGVVVANLYLLPRLHYEMDRTRYAADGWEEADLRVADLEAEIKRLKEGK